MAKKKPRPTRSGGRKKRPRLKGFGTYLVETRGAMGFNTQQEAADRLSQNGEPASQSLVAKYESGRVTDPSPVILRRLAELYGARYLKVIAKLVQDKYVPEGGWPPADRAKWALIEDIIDQPDEEDLLRSRRVQIQAGRVLDVPAMGHWQKKVNYPDLQQFWLVAPNFLDDQSEEIFETVKENLNDGVEYCYFLYRQSLERFLALKGRLGQALKTDIWERMRAYELPGVSDDDHEAASQWLGTIYMVANPHRLDRAKAYQCIRQHGVSYLALEMDALDTSRLYMALYPLTKPGNRLDKQV